MKERKVEILLTNDDGVQSPGLKEAAAICSKFGNVTVVAPKFPQSGMSAAITLGSSMWLTLIAEKRCENGNKITTYSFTGTPADCIKIAMNSLFSISHKPDMLVSGINHGSNASAAAVYSGTLGATKEGAIYSVPSLALSIENHNPDADLSVVREYAPIIIEKFLANPPSEGIYLNVNFPDIKPNIVKGIKFAEQGSGMWIKEFKKFKPPYGPDFYMMFGEFLDKDKTGMGDHTAVAEGYISIVPHKINTTDYAEMERLGKLWNL